MGSILATVKEAVEEILHRIVLIVAVALPALATLACLGVRTALSRDGLAFQNLRGGDIHDGGFNAADDAGERGRSRDGIGQAQRSWRSCPQTWTWLSWRRFGPTLRSRSNADDQCQKQKYRREKLSPARPTNNFAHSCLLLCLRKNPRRPQKV